MKTPMKVKGMMPDEITASEAAKQMNVCESTVYRYVKRGWIPAARRGNQVVLKKSVPGKVNLAQLAPSDMHWSQRIQWEQADVQFAGAPTATVTHQLGEEQPSPKNISVKDELLGISRRLKSLGLKYLAGQVALEAASI